MLLRKETTGLQPGLMHTGALDDGIGAGKVDVLKHTQGVGGGAAVILDAAQTLVVGNHDLTGLDIAHKLGTHCIQRAALTGEGPAGAIGQLADAERAEAVRIARGDKLGVGHDDQTVSTLNVIHRAADSHLDIGGQQTVLGQQVGNYLGIGGAVEDRTAHFQLAAQLGGVDQIAVVADSHGTLAVMQNHRLRVGPAALTGGGIAHMAGGHLGTLGQLLQNALGENLADKAQIAVAGKHAVHIQGDAAALLPAVLQRVQCAVDVADHIGRAGFIVDTKDAALLVQTLGIMGKFAHRLLHLSEC